MARANHLSHKFLKRGYFTENEETTLNQRGEDARLRDGHRSKFPGSAAHGTLAQFL
jgi:hypothetical protein